MKPTNKQELDQLITFMKSKGASKEAMRSVVDDFSRSQTGIGKLSSFVTQQAGAVVEQGKELAKAPLSSTEQAALSRAGRLGVPEQEAKGEIMKERVLEGEPVRGVAERAKEGFVEGLQGSEDKIQRRVEGRMEEEKQMESLTGMDKVFAKLTNLGKEVGTGISVVTEPFIRAVEEVAAPIVQPIAEGAGKATVSVWEALYGEDVAETAKQEALGKINNLFQAYENLPDDQKEVIDNTLRFADVATMFGGGKVAKEVGEEAIEQGLKVGAKGVELVEPIIKKGAEVVEETAGAVKKFVSKTPEQIKKQADEVVGTIAQGKAADIPRIKQALAMTDTTGVKTYDDLAQVASSNIEGLSSKLDEFLDTQPGIYKLKDLSTSVKVGEKTVSQNFVKKALDHLAELYIKTDDLAALARIKQISSKATKEGLTLKEVNQIAKEYGSTFGQKAFSKTGDPLTSVNAVAYENIRKGIKNTFRGKIDNDIAKTIDLQISDFYKLQAASKKMAEKVNALAQKVQKRNLMQRIARKLADVVDVATFGVPKSFISRLFIPSNVGNKVMNSLDLQEQLVKNLKQLDGLLKASDDELVEALVKEAKPVSKPFKKAGEPSTAKIKEVKGWSPEDPLLQEARKYKSAEEFVKGELKKQLMGEQTSVGIYGDKYFALKNSAKNNLKTVEPIGTVGEMFKSEKLNKIIGDAKDIPVYTVKDAGFNGRFSTEGFPKIEMSGNKMMKFDETLLEEAIHANQYLKGRLSKRGVGKDYATDLNEVLAKEGASNINAILIQEKLKTKSQLTDIWEKAKAGSKVDPLIQEAKKYKSAEEFVKEVDDERITFSTKDEKGSVILIESTPEYELLPDITEKQLAKLGLDESDFITKIEHIEVDKSSQGQGIGTSLMNRAIKEVIDNGHDFVYLNASPMGNKGMSLEGLTKFYEKFGFKVIKKQGNNNLMGATKSQLIDIWKKANQ